MSPSPHILIVDDDLAILGLVEAILSQKGYDVVTAANGPDALRVFRGSSRRFDLLVTDVIMPGMSGTELLEMLAGTELLPPVLLISGYPGSVQLDLLERRLGMRVPLLGKPFSAAGLLSKVEELLPPRAAHEVA